MIETWFTSDTHFGHKNILQFEPAARPFATLEEMHEQLIANWNARIKPCDIVYHLGDFCFGKHNLAIAAKLNGKKRLVMGNHDTYVSASYLEYFEKLYGVVHWERCILSHMPVHPNQLGSRWMLNVHGHLHSKVVMSNQLIAPDKEYPMNWCMKPDPNYFNVAVEQNALFPFHRDEIMVRIKEIDK
jgi:calcineurin-like phosphoesterase family protein